MPEQRERRRVVDMPFVDKLNLISPGRRSGSSESSSASTSRSSTEQTAKRVKRSNTASTTVGTVATAKESFDTAVKSKKSKMSFEENPFGLQEDAKGWLLREANLAEPKRYTFHSNKRPISKQHLQKVVDEYWERVKETEAAGTETPIHPVLVALGVTKKAINRLIERGVIGKGRFLYFPTLGLDGRRQGALFLIYLGGNWHSSANGEVQTMFGTWRVSEDWLEEATCIQPDLRICPQDLNGDRDNNGNLHPNDRDPDNEDGPFSRLVFEIEYAHRNIINVRRHGKSLMDSSNNYTRLFLACKISKPDDNNNTFTAAMVLWRKDHQNAIVMDRAISFGTRDLHGDTKTAWARGPNEDRPAAEFLPLVQINEWHRPADANLAPTLSANNLALRAQNGNHNCNEWILTLPAESLLYRVMGNFGGNWEYFNDHLNSNNLQVGNMEIDLLKLSSYLHRKILARASRANGDNVRVLRANRNNNP